MSTPCVDVGGQAYMSPDGARLAFSWNPHGQWEIFLASTQAVSPHRRLSAGAGSKFSPRWSPDGKRLAYAVDLDGSEQNDLSLCEVSSGENRNITPDTPDSIQPGFCWSPDGQKLAFISDRSRDFKVYLLPSQNGQTQQFSQLHRTIQRVDWSPDSRRLAFSSDLQGFSQRGIYEIETGVIHWMTGHANARQPSKFSFFYRILSGFQAIGHIDDHPAAAA